MGKFCHQRSFYSNKKRADGFGSLVFLEWWWAVPIIRYGRQVRRQREVDIHHGQRKYNTNNHIVQGLLLTHLH